jgi:hypothetical protein
MINIRGKIQINYELQIANKIFEDKIYRIH